MTTSLEFYPPVIAHRGASAYAPENTLAAFIKAAQLGIKWVEFDVMQAASGEPIIFHDDLLDRTTDGKGEVSHYSYTYLQTLDAGRWFDSRFSGERIPTLLQTIKFLQEAKLSANVEIKAQSGHEEKLVIRVLDELAPYLHAAQPAILFSSFSLDALHFLRQHSPHCLMGLLLHEWEPDWQYVCTSLQCISVHVNHEIMTREAAQKIKSMDKILLCYTVNDPARAAELYSWGVDAVFSDIPDRIVDGNWNIPK
ncbi:glycerophosphoryl diester phosphodiesterase [Aquicella lusitana]|uniref:Glycerophosphoryl diester phosphodiesterase n=1 Tax=Aquicella lusitana TaxID=254246 RepID=A0A370GZT9_9COXI|nr:glycerophosphoryl diester phosphodiesterase [Aquicella lusitana]RDI48827.1 glycerophosphoryl diester phosphodiesterase [Aquicella lusitana]VVC73255.1 Glycerophosphoryl diester phosphodiesterase [Aquicella lusitana]